jgi:hypothetical protein
VRCALGWTLRGRMDAEDGRLLRWAHGEELSNPTVDPIAGNGFPRPALTEAGDTLLMDLVSY